MTGKNVMHKLWMVVPVLALTAVPYALALPGLWTRRSTTSPNLVGGYYGNNIAFGIMGATVGGDL